MSQATREGWYGFSPLFLDLKNRRKVGRQFFGGENGGGNLPIIEVPPVIVAIVRRGAVELEVVHIEAVFTEGAHDAGGVSFADIANFAAVDVAVTAVYVEGKVPNEVIVPAMARYFAGAVRVGNDADVYGPAPGGATATVGIGRGVAVT